MLQIFLSNLGNPLQFDDEKTIFQNIFIQGKKSPIEYVCFRNSFNMMYLK